MADFKLNPSENIIGHPVEIGEASLICNQPLSILSVSPFKGRGMAVSDALKAAVKLDLPTVGAVTSRNNICVMWAGQGQWFVIGEFETDWLSDALKEYAAVTDQSDAWISLTLGGEDVDEVMSRLCSLDFSRLNLGQTVRAEFAHMVSCITPIEGGYEVMVMRSFAKTAVQHIRTAMTKLAAQKSL